MSDRKVVSLSERRIEERKRKQKKKAVRSLRKQARNENSDVNITDAISWDEVTKIVTGVDPIIRDINLQLSVLANMVSRKREAGLSITEDVEVLKEMQEKWSSLYEQVKTHKGTVEQYREEGYLDDLLLIRDVMVNCLTPFSDITEELLNISSKAENMTTRIKAEIEAQTAGESNE